jgi:signal transduction histidine kinase
MVNTAAVVSEEEPLILSTLSPGSAQTRFALAVVVGLLSVFLLIAAGPLGRIQTPPIPAFVPAYATAMFVCDSVTAFLLYAQFSILRSRAILVIASGYLFTALILVPWILAFPGVFAPGSGLIGGLQTTSWLYFAEHAGLPLFAIAYVLLKDTETERRAWHRTTRFAIALSATLTAGLVSLVAFVCVAGEAALPRVVLDSLHLSPLWPYAGAPVALASLSGLIVLWMRRRTMLDLWLMVVMCLYTVEIPLSYYPTPSRFSMGWYAVRVLGFLSSTVILGVLLYEIQAIYTRLLDAVLGQRREREARLMTGDAVAATIAHEVRQPLTAIMASAQAAVRFLDRGTPSPERAQEALRRIIADSRRAEDVIASVRAVFRSDSTTRTSLDLNEVIRDALVLERGDLQKHQVKVHVEPGAEVPAVHGDRVQLQQVLLNLITNAIHAMADADEPRLLRLRTGVHEGDQVMVSVADSGHGIDPRDVDRIFSPLFTTKTDGMGMGLSICRAIIEAHDGRLWVVPNSPRGTAFHFTLRGETGALVRSRV